MHSLLCICGYICSSKTRLSLTRILIFPPFVGLDLCCACCCPRPQFNFKLHRGTKTFYSYIHITCTIPKNHLVVLLCSYQPPPVPATSISFGQNWTIFLYSLILYILSRSFHVAYYASKPWHCCFQWGCSNKQVSLGTQYLSRDKLIQVFMKYWRTVSEACS